MWMDLEVRSKHEENCVKCLVGLDGMVGWNDLWGWREAEEMEVHSMKMRGLSRSSSKGRASRAGLLAGAGGKKYSAGSLFHLQGTDLAKKGRLKLSTPHVRSRQQRKGDESATRRGPPHRERLRAPALQRSSSQRVRGRP